jgi:formate dehydrogenase
LGCDHNALGLRKWLEDQGHTLVVTTDKENDVDSQGNVIRVCEFEREMKDANVVISQPFYPGYVTPERIKNSPNLKLALTAGVGSDHVALQEAWDAGITVAEITGSNVVSVAEHVLMAILALVRNYMPAYKQVVEGEWDIAGIADRAWDLEGKQVGTVAAGRIGYRVMQRLKPFDVGLHYYDYARLSADQEKALGCTFHESVEEMVPHLDVITINCPLHGGTEYLFDRKMLEKCKPGAFIVNTARGKIVDENALADAVDSGHIGGYAGDVWFPQPAPRTHPWRLMPRHAMTPHYSGTTLDAQARYAAGTKAVLEQFFADKPIQPQEYVIIDPENNYSSPAYPDLRGMTKKN